MDYMKNGNFYFNIVVFTMALAGLVFGVWGHMRSSYNSSQQQMAFDHLDVLQMDVDSLFTFDSLTDMRITALTRYTVQEVKISHQNLTDTLSPYVVIGDQYILKDDYQKWKEKNK
jgi:hypothetical protein